jgi:signal transduction histidine kinase
MKVSTDPKRKGTGLGLAITKKILDLHRAEIHYVSNSKGACFHILI